MRFHLVLLLLSLGAGNPALRAVQPGPASPAPAVSPQRLPSPRVATNVPPGQLEGAALVADLLSRLPTDNLESTGVFNIRDGRGKNTQVPVTLKVIAGTNAWQSVYETNPTNAIAERLTIVHTPGQPNRYRLALKSASAGAWQETVLEAGPGLARSFGGSDFSVCDLGLEFLHWPQQRVLKKEMRKGRPCKVLESQNPDSRGSEYARVLSWIDSASSAAGIVLAEAYAANKKQIKAFEVRSMQQVNDVWQVKKLTITNEQTESRTHLELDLDNQPAPAEPALQQE